VKKGGPRVRGFKEEGRVFRKEKAETRRKEGRGYKEGGRGPMGP
jgi:hypothetical protein